MPAPRVTVLIGCWNNAPTLPRAIESILSQTLADLELIVVDDGSIDETAAIVDGYDDPRVSRLALEHMGIALSLNRGMAEAASDVVAFQDADDFSKPERLEKQLAVLDRWADVAVVGCWMDEIDDSGHSLVPRQPRIAGLVGKGLIRFNPIPGTCSMIRLDAAHEAGDFNPSFRFAQDYDLWARMAARHELFCLDEVLATRQMHGAAAGSRHERDQIRETLRVRRRLLRRSGNPLEGRHLLRPFVSLVTPPAVKAVVRRHRDMAP
jgi:glycosyltransferase involved in cell wall biosynthesis